ncbi:copper resistance protein CopA [Pseudidiomarina salinarum]|uniref:Copper resistance protein CopA n=1 Tax=Pseudidiomarina salinarum TaxID=435908 RepID=A0A094ISB3_9GAMM|nr:copper resistance system multicopper oxidase [Pseudidiomarina salinarum]KFZ30580.1 copper resistance protein CopA [Pseudidiomarina salinarum]RUO69091.1 copper resistance system multicopper oxidase [Pseudidiomarina salinarum]
MSSEYNVGRRKFVKSAVTLASALAIARVAPTWAIPQGRSFKDQVMKSDEIDLMIARTPLPVGQKLGKPITINGQMPGPLIRLTEGDRAKLNVTNRLAEDTSIHWHGIILPENMDGVPGVSFEGIKPGRTFKYRYDVQQNGTYWYHSHSGLQEQLGHLGPLIIEPKDGDIGADREHTIVLSDWTFEDPDEVFRKLKVAEGYYNYQKRTIFDTIEDIRKKGLKKTWKERAMWGEMRMSARDIADVTGSSYTYLMNGRDSAMNWSGLYKPGEKVRLRIINGSAMTFFDVRIPGLEMTVVAADGQPVKPVAVDEFRIGVAETYDVVVQPKDRRAYTIFAESFDRSGYVRGTLTHELGLAAPVPELRSAPERGMAAMGMSEEHMGMGNNGENGHAMAHKKTLPVENIEIKHSEEEHGAGAAMVATNPVSRLNEPGLGLENADHRVLVYADLIGAQEWPDTREPGRQIELHLTGNMERYMWSFDGDMFTEVDGPVQFHQGERLRLVLVNDTMMDHPIHLHGMWMELENGQYPRPRKHTISLKPSEKVSLLISADAPGSWAFHCHLLYHMHAGMFRVVNVA